MTTFPAPASETVPPRRGLHPVRYLAVVIVVNAVIQTLLTLGDPTPGVSVGFVALAVLSFIAASLWLCLIATLLCTRKAGFRPRWRTLVYSAIVVAAVVVCAIVTPALALAPIVVATFALPAAAVSDRVLPTLGLAIRRSPLRFAGTTLLAIVLSVVTSVVSLLLGFFITGFLAALVTWLWFGLCAVLLLLAARSFLNGRSNSSPHRWSSSSPH